MGACFRLGIFVAIFALFLQMSRRKFNDLEIEHELEELFALPDNPEQSEDDLESDEEVEAQYSTARFLNILERLDNDTDTTSTPFLENQPSPQPSVGESDCYPASDVQENGSILTPSASTSRRTRPRSSTPAPSTPVPGTRPRSQPASDDTGAVTDDTRAESYDTSTESEDDDEMWKKVE